MFLKKTKENLFFFLIIFSGINPLKSNEFFVVNESSSQGTYLLESFNADTGLYTSISSRQFNTYFTPDLAESFYDGLNQKFYIQ